MYFLTYGTLEELLTLNDEILLSALKRTYLIDGGPYELVEIALEMNDLLGKDVLEPYSLHLMSNFRLIENVIARLGVNPTYLEEVKEMNEDTFQDLHNGGADLSRRQENYFENSLMFKIKKVSSSEDIAKGYEDYINYLDGFNVIAFNKVIETISEEKEVIIADFQAQFDYIPKYMVEKYRLEQLKQSLSNKEAPKKELEEKIKNLNESASTSFEKIVELFNELNTYALLNRIAKPYPFKYNKILVDNEDHRKDVQKVLLKHTPIKTMANIHADV